jgi:hypothetical protein
MLNYDIWANIHTAKYEIMASNSHVKRQQFQATIHLIQIHNGLGFVDTLNQI